MHLRRSQKQGGLHDLLGRQPGRVPPPPFHEVHPDAEGQVRPAGPQGADDGPDRYSRDAERQGGRHLSADSTRQGLRDGHRAARDHQGTSGGPGAGRGDRADRRAAAGPRRPDEACEVRCHLLRHGRVDDPRQAHELGGDPHAGRRDERLHEVRLHADARPRQRDGRRRRPSLHDGVPVRRQPVARFSTVQPRGVFDRSTCWSAATTTRR